MRKIRLLIIGAGGHGRSVAEAAELSGAFDVAGFLDEGLPVGQTVLMSSVLGVITGLSNVDHLKSYRTACDQAIVAVGYNAVREKLMQHLIDVGFDLATVIHPQAFVSPSAVVGMGSAVMAGAIVGTEAQLGIGVIVNYGAVVDHHAKVVDFGHLGVSACMAGGSILGRNAWMKAGCALGSGVEVTAGASLRPGTALG
jgi:sugar O-acyltransferase (sialic acid O-acetyltransferase NeuD family)